MPRLLVVDDEPMICYSLQKVFSSETTEVITAGTLAEAREKYLREHPDVLVLDLQLPDGCSLKLFDEIRARDPKRPVIFLTAHGTADTAIEAMKHGAFDYLIKPVDLAKLSSLLPMAFEAARLMDVPAILPTDPGGDRIIGRSQVMQEMCKSIGRLAGQEVNVLILGESGTGKELIARALYQHSRRANRPFLAINCAAMPENLVESELFGHEQGAFTGADRQRIGKFEQCDGGTLLLDEVGDMTLATQAKMLRLLQEQQFERVGGNQLLTTRVRILAATNRNLEELIADGKFRADLYYRLKAVTIRVPPLRDRREDIPELAHHFLYQYARELNRDIRGYSPEALNRLQQYSWPGNVRELQGVIREAILAAVGHTMLPEHLPPTFGGQAVVPVSPPSNTLDVVARIEQLFTAGATNIYSEVIADVERELLIQALKRTHGHQAQASDLLGINRTTLRTKLRDLGITLDKVVANRPAGE
ncbi:sigma-54-dependent transcriptional regulator [Zavarzinella formosa]|uniref:sigma-54-dependent transcriptional regulator n=1 Tax=Zavarzinella formosa TaxID=360055 RepID=UPI0002FC824C|nr:sigma-54 dependent transcriptional regulator [Zavarzinella formosa]